MDIEQQLRTELAGRAAQVDSAPPGLHDAVVGAAHRQRRRRLAVAAACAVAVAVAVPVGTTVGSGDTSGRPGDETSSQQLVDRFTPYELAPRGSLAGDPASIAALTSHVWSPSGHEDEGFWNPDPATTQVVFAGDVPGGVEALVIGRHESQWWGLWLRGDPGTPAADLTAALDATPLDVDAPISVNIVVDGTGALVVLARPGDLIELSPGTEVSADGTVTQLPYTSIGDADGVAAVDSSALAGVYLRVRVTRDGQVVTDQGVSGSASGGDPDATASGLADALARAAGTPDGDLARLLLEGVLQQLGLTGDQVQVAVPWGGPIGNRNDEGARGIVLQVTLPSGATVLLGGYGDTQTMEGPATDAIGTAGPCLQTVVPAGADLSDPLVAMRCDLYSTTDGASFGSQLVVVPPAGTASLQLTGSDGGVIGQPDVDGPAYVAAAPDGLTGITALDADGAVLASSPLLGVTALGPN